MSKIDFRLIYVVGMEDSYISQGRHYSVIWVV